MAPDGKTIFVHSNDNNMYAINADVTAKHANRLIWNYNSKYDPDTVDFGAAVSSKDGSLVYAFAGINTSQNAVSAFTIQTKTGNAGWNITLLASAYTVVVDPVLSPDGSTIYIGVESTNYHPSTTHCQGDTVFCLLHFDAATGKFLTNLSFPIQGHQLVVSESGSAAFRMGQTPDSGDSGCYISAYNPNNGSSLWNSTCSTSDDFDRVLTLDQNSLYTVSPDGNHLLAAPSHEYGLVSINARTGEFAWTYVADDIMAGQPLVSPDSTTVFVGCDDHSLYAFHTDTGRMLWTFRTGGRVGPPTVTDKTGSGGTVVFASADGAVYEVDAETGVEIWAFQLTPSPSGHDDDDQNYQDVPTLVPLASPDGSTVFVASGDGTVYALSTKARSTR
jgi:outer membrane protein assembly factor BamB